NHFHLLLETPQPNLVVGMKWLMGVYCPRSAPAMRSGIRSSANWIKFALRAWHSGPQRLGRG
ncbi:MAG: hypothetical protein ACQKBU_12135, partial [Verrucomicrobiales bacterium]